tara:strand:- start:294 stop:1121 length:828 start_codon:yes stop_codon:yes gene_type:complete
VQVSFVDVDGIRTRYLHEGSGDKTLLLIHGFGISADGWARVIDPFAKDYSVYAPDILGHGFTAFKDPGVVGAPLFMARHLVGFMDKVGIKNCAIAGSSLGGVLAPLMYFERPDQVTHLILDGIHTPVTDSGTLGAETVRASMANGTKAMSNVTWQSCIDRMGNICFDPAKSPPDIALIQVTIYAQEDRLSSYVAIGESIIAHTDDDATRIRPEKIKVPTLFICGRDDIRVPSDVVIANHDRIAGSELSIFDECGHLPEVEHPEKFVDIVTTFLRK